MDTKLEKDIKNIQEFNFKEGIIEKYKPKKLMIEVTNNCNSKCIFCGNCNMTRKRSFVSEKIVKKALEQGIVMGIREVGFYTNGEPLLDKNIEKYIEYAKKNLYDYVYITTNGILANKNRVKALFDSGLDSIKFSINSIEKENYKNMQGVNCFEKVVENLRNTYYIKKSQYPNKKVYVSYVKTKMNNYKDDEIKHFFEEYCDGVLIQEVRNQGGLISNIEKLKINNHENIYNLPCFYPFNTVIVTCEGYITACCMDFQNYLVYGNLNEKKLQDIWNNDVIQELRRKHLNGKIEDTICKNCIDNKFEQCKPLMECYSCNVEFDKWRKE
jgi:hypothetical protein